MHEEQEFSAANVVMWLLGIVLAIQVGWLAYSAGKDIAAQPFAGQETVQAGASMGAVNEDAAEPANGESIYAGNCAGCHGGSGEGVVGPNLQTAAGWNLAEFSEATLHGVRPDGTELASAMPRFADTGLSGETATDEQMEALHNYIQSLY